MMEVAAEDDDVPRQEQADDAPPSIDEQQPEAQPLHAPPAESGRSGALDVRDRGEGPARTALSLVLHGADEALLAGNSRCV